MPYGVFYNVNFPALPAAEVRGCARDRAGPPRGRDLRGRSRRSRRTGASTCGSRHGRGNDETPPGSDARECHDGHITVTPLRADLTAHDLVAPLAEALA